MGIINFGELSKDGTKSKWKQWKGLQRETERWERELGKYGAPRTEMIHVQRAWCLNKRTDKNRNK